MDPRRGFHVRTDLISPSHTCLTLFANGGNCGRLVFRNNEAEAFISCLKRGCEGLVVDFLHTPIDDVICGVSEDTLSSQ